MHGRLAELYDRSVLGRPKTVLILCALAVLIGAWYAQDFEQDATTESLTLEHDQDLKYYRSIRARYGSDDYLIVTVTPQGDLFAPGTLADIAQLRNELALLPDITAVTSILDVPLLRSPPVDTNKLATGIRRLDDESTDIALARRELLTSPLYERLVISADSRTTALRVDLAENDEYLRLREARDTLREKQLVAELTSDEVTQLKLISRQFDAFAQSALDRQQRQIAAVRAVLSSHSGIATLHVGGVPMIVADSMGFIRHDLVLFGAAVVFFLVAILFIAFRKPRWVVLPLITCLATSIIMLGLLGFMHLRVTVVSSNFISLLLILSLALTLHIIVRYREIHETAHNLDQFTLVQTTVRRVFVPCLYTALTTMVAFGSLIVSGIRPVTDFGWMMVVGIAVSFVLSFTLFPAALVLLPAGEAASRKDLTARITTFFANLIIGQGKRTLFLFFLLAVLSVLGTTRLTVENRFIDYYHKSTEIYRGMEIIDRHLGGTTPLDVIIDAPVQDLAATLEPELEDDLDDLNGDDLQDDLGITSKSYWFNRLHIGEVLAIHDYLDGLAQTGKVISIGTTARIIQQLDRTILDNNYEMSLLYKRLPDDVKATLFEPYLSEDGNQLRFGIRVYESDPNLRRAKLISDIRAHLTQELGLEDNQVHLTGMLVLYNNMLESLFRSQIVTLGAVFLAITLMFLALFRSFVIALIAITPNIFSAAIVLGLMGWAGISLDLMTITIAAITIGIGVDDTIHYLHRFEYEFSRDRDYWAAIRRCHGTIGRAMYYTSVTVMLGFSILSLSNFVPTIYFGLLTGLAMLVALFANMTLLPVLIATFRAIGPEVQIMRPKLS